MEDIRSSILQMAKGAIQERVDYEVTRVIDNILDVNTKPTEKRKVVLTIEMKPDEARQVITLSASAKSTLAATTPIASSLVITADGDVWKLEATRNIAGYFEEALKDLIESGSVVVIR